MINLNFRDGRSLHEQIESGIKELIISGVLKADDKLPSVRELSVSLTVNPNTVQRAYKQLESDGFIYSIKAKGNFVAPSCGADIKRTAEIYEEIKSLVNELKFMGEEEDSVKKFISDIYAEKEEKI